jgi:ABC-2 type transport system ATP-binding protein/lipopolysaccharide transport system ATP-binding protein
MDKISEFSELGPYLEAPVRTYSQGMRLRLALAVVLHIEPDILLLDEWIGVSDARFANRVRPAVRDFVQRSSVLLLATHNIELAKNFCSHGIILEQGTLKAFGPIDEIVEQYGSVDLKVLKDRAS